MAVGEEADVADPVKAVGHGVLQEAADELVGRKRHDLGLAVLPIVFPGEADLVVVEPDQAAVGNGHAVRVAAEVAEHLLGPGERRLGEDDPVDPGGRVEPGSEGGGVGQACERTATAEFTVGESGAQLTQEQVAEAAGQHAHRQEEARFAGDPARVVGRDPATGDDAVKMRVMVQRLSPGMQHRDRADLGAEVARVGGDAAQRLRRRAEQNGVDHRLVVERDLGDGGRQREHDVEVRGRQQFGLPRIEPVGARKGLALRTMPITAANGNFPLPASWANSVMGSQRRLSVEFRPFSSAMALLRTFILSP